MATFTLPDNFKEHKQYAVLLKKALLAVKPEMAKKFLYYRKYPFGPKQLQLVLVDFDPGCAAALAKAGHKPTDEGLVSLTEQDELNFEAKKGSLKRIRLRKYFATMPGLKGVFVPPGEVDDEEDAEAVVEAMPAAAAPPPASQTAAATPPAAKPPPPAPPAPAAASRQPEENQLKLRQLLTRIEETRKKPVPPSLDGLKEQFLNKAKSLGQAGQFADATRLLDQFTAKAGAAGAQTAGTAEATKAPAPLPKLSAYMNATRDWKVAKKTAADGVFALKNAIFKECDPELKDAVKARIDGLNGILTVMDDGIIDRIQEAGNEADEERQAERNETLAKFANNMLAEIRGHPLAEVADSNPFGVFTIRSPVEGVLTRFAADFGG